MKGGQEQGRRGKVWAQRTHNGKGEDEMSFGSRIGSKRVFGVCGNGNFTSLTPGLKEKCVCCGKSFKTWGIVVEFFEYGVVCPGCILSGPKEMAQRIRNESIPIAIKAMEGREDAIGWTVPYLTQMAELLEKKKSIADFPNGIFAVKIAEGYQETKAANRKGKAA
jgi:hypothetical protein